MRLEQNLLVLDVGQRGVVLLGQRRGEVPGGHHVALQIGVVPVDGLHGVVDRFRIWGLLKYFSPVFACSDLP